MLYHILILLGVIFHDITWPKTKYKWKNHIKQRFIDLGFISGTKITPVLTSPSGNIRAYYIKDTLLAIRDDESKKINIKF